MEVGEDVSSGQRSAETLQTYPTAAPDTWLAAVFSSEAQQYRGVSRGCQSILLTLTADG